MNENGSESEEARHRFSTIASIVYDNKWDVAEGTHDDKPLIIRFRNDFLKMPNIAGYEHLLLITWNYTMAPSGLPNSTDSKIMNKFEDQLIDIFENDLVAVITATITNNGSRQWVFYTKDVPECVTRLNHLPTFPIDLETETDENWLFFYDNILSGMVMEEDADKLH